jgi:hypothetical protein
MPTVSGHKMTVEAAELHPVSRPCKAFLVPRGASLNRTGMNGVIWAAGDPPSSTIEKPQRFKFFTGWWLTYPSEKYESQLG